MTLELHHLHLSQSERIVWLLEEMQVPYTLVVHTRDPKTAASPPALKNINPHGTAPFLRDNSVQPPVTLSESGAIVQYVLDLYGPKAPGTRMSRHLGDVDYPHYVSWLHYANGTLQPSMSLLGTLRVANAYESPIGKLYLARAKSQLKMLDDHLGQSKYLAGNEVTAADAMTVYTLTTGRGFNPFDLTGYDNILRYLRHVAERTAYREAIRKGDGGMNPMINPVERRHEVFANLVKTIED